MASINPEAVIAQVQAIQKIMKSVMIEGTHYGVIPGTNKKSLYKPGAEVLLSTFRIAVRPVITEQREGDHVHYDLRCIGEHMGTMIVVGEGVGSAGTAEEKYAWRGAVCQEEFDATPVDRRRVKWFKGYQGADPYSALQIRTNPRDQTNTVLKMAKKRAMIDLCMTALACSDIFTQDLDPEDGDPGEGSRPPAAKNAYQAQPRSNAPAGDPNKVATEGQVKLLKARLSSTGKDEAELLKKFGASSIETLKMSQVNAVIDWIAGK